MPENKEKIMPALQNNGGDVLARGGVRCTFKPMGQKMSKESWEKLFEKDETPVVKAVYVFKCPVHGEFVSDRETFVSGGFPLVNEYAKGVCPTTDCGEKSDYAGYKEIGSDASAQAGTDGPVAGEAVTGA